MKYLVYYKYKVLLEILENNLVKDYRELESTIINFLIENDKDILRSAKKIIDLKIRQTEKLINKLNIEASVEKISDYFIENEFPIEYKLLLKKKSQKIMNALNLVNFTNINTLNYHIYTFNDEKILSLSYYKIKEYYKNKDKEIKRIVILHL